MLGTPTISELTGREPPASAVPKLDMGGFSGLLEEVWKTSQAAAMEKIQDTMDRAKSGGHLKIVYEHLTESAKRTLERIKEERKDLRRDEWLGLCRELKDAGVITKSDFDCTRADMHLIPMGDTGENGEIVPYTICPILVKKLERMGGLSAQFRNSTLSKREIWEACDDWSGDPLAYLDDWSRMLCRWRSDMTGMNLYDDFSPINEQIDSCQKVMNLVQMLCRF